MAQHVFSTNDGLTADDRLPNALFASRALYDEFAPEQRVYEAAVASYAAETRPAAVRQAVAFARLHGFRISQAFVRECARDDLRETLISLCGSDDADVQWHIANPGKRQATVFTSDPRLFASWCRNEKKTKRGGWRGPYSRRVAS